MLRPYAMHEAQSRGRRHAEGDYPDSRGLYERDVDRIIHSRAFKRLANKTQVITGGESDHHRTRLTHSIEVSALCRSVARHLGLNRDLASALGFAHDLGHPPLGHCGEEILNQICAAFGDTFEHNRHTLTIVDEFEQKYADIPGLNLTFETREGIAKHSAGPGRVDPDLDEFEMDRQPTLEAQLVDACDEVCYCYSDLDDVLEQRLTDLDTIRRHLAPFGRLFEEMTARFPGAHQKLLFNETLRRLMNATVRDLTETTRAAIDTAGLSRLEEVRRAGRRLVGHSPEMGEWLRELKGFLSERYYQHPAIQKDRDTNGDKIRQLFRRYHEDETLLPARYQDMINREGRPRHRVIVYYIAGFTDRYLSQTFVRHGL